MRIPAKRKKVVSPVTAPAKAASSARAKMAFVSPAKKSDATMTRLRPNLSAQRPQTGVIKAKNRADAVRMPATCCSVRPASRASGVTTTKLIVMPTPIAHTPSAMMVVCSGVSGRSGFSISPPGDWSLMVVSSLSVKSLLALLQVSLGCAKSCPWGRWLYFLRTTDGNLTLAQAPGTGQIRRKKL